MITADELVVGIVLIILGMGLMGLLVAVYNKGYQAGYEKKNDHRT